MGSESRTSKSITNGRVTLLFMIATFLLNFLSRKFFLDGLGPEVMGMRTTLGTVLNMLSLSELGIGSAIAVALYKPLADKDYTKINEIVSLQGWLYTRVFAFIFLGVTVLMLFMPSMLEGMKAPLIYAYLTVGIFFMGTMFSYTINYKSIVLSADQKNYKTSMILSSAGLVKNIVQLFILSYVPEPYPYWLAMDLLLMLLGVYVIDKVTYKEYPWLKIDKSRGREYLKKYPEILKQTGMLFVHSLATFALTQATPWFLFSFVGLVSVTYYENYKNLIANVRAAIFSVFTNMGPAIASLISEGDKEKAYAFFWEMFSLKFLVAGVACFGLFFFISPFISIWLGTEYVMGVSTVLLLTLTAYLDFTRVTVDSYIIGYRLFNDVWAPIVEGVMNILLAIVLGNLYGFNGILVGTYISLFLIVKIWKPIFLFSKGFSRSPWLYWRGGAKFFFINAALMYIAYLFMGSLQLDLSSSYLHLFGHAAWLVPLYTVILFAVYYIVSDGFRKMTVRLLQLATPMLQRIKLR